MQNLPMAVFSFCLLPHRAYFDKMSSIHVQMSFLGGR
jgi:hypothetical protein